MSGRPGRWTRRLAAWAALLLAACVRAPPADLSRDPAALLEAVQSSQAKAQRVRGGARVRIDAPDMKGTVDELIAAEKPDRLRLETLDFFGNVAAVLVADGRSFAFYDAREGTYYRGEPTPQNVSRFLPVVLPAAALATILCGSAPILPGAPLSAEVDGGALALTVGSPLARQRLLVGEGATVESSRLSGPAPAGGGLAAYDLDFAVFRHRGGARFPNEIELDAPAEGVRVTLRWKDDLEVNTPLDPALFRLEPPRGAKVLDLSSGASVPEVRLPIRPAPGE